MSANIETAIAIIRKELTELDGKLRDLDDLRAQRDNLRAALRSLTNAKTPETARAAAAAPQQVDFTEAMRRFVGVHGADPEPQPSGPTEAALMVLREAAGTPLHIRDIVTRIHLKGWFVDREYESLRATIVGTLNLRAEHAPDFHKTAPSTYRLDPA